MKTYHILTLLVVFLFTGCLKEEKMSIGALIKVNMPEGFENTSPEGIDVKLYSTTSGLTYTSKCDASGIATFNVEYGFYEAVAQHRERGENTIDIFNGRMERIVLSERTKDGDTYTINLTHAKLQQLIIKEIYYAACKKDDGKNYGKDAYMSIYNNSDEIAYLDSLCIGTVNPVTSSSPSNFTKPDGSLWDEIPLFMMAWQFPGTGTDYPLQPGEETIIALNAINHVDIASQSVDLSKADFAFWDPLLTGASVPAPGVEPLKMLWRNSGTAFTISLTGPAMVIFKIPTTVAESAQAYAEDPGNLQLDPVKPNASQKFLMIHKDWVIDGVECVTSASKANKRIPNNIDAGFTYIPTSYLGNSVCRKVDEVVDGRTIYMDSNNSSEDFEVVPNTLKNR